ncbi:MAG TPA: DUF1858 domain-containing protein, partial [Gemmataceae bacterium]|nr:DUF1858 domain-containing protein [Gemmataceae bacterium]
DYPGCREVLRHHGEPEDRPTKFGHLGPLDRFARRHGTDLGQLLDELSRAAGVGVDREAAQAERAHRPFIAAALAVTLTLGAGWGALLLFQIGWGGGFAAVPAGYVSALEVVAIGLCVAIVFRTWRASGKPLAVYDVDSTARPLADRAWRASGKPLAVYDGYVAAALVWFFLQAVYEAVYLAATLAAVTPEQLVPLVATWQAPLRDMQIHGFALLVILGVSQRLLPHFYGLPAPGRRVSVAGLVCLNAAVVGEMAGLILMRRAGHAWAGLWYGSVLLLAATVAVLVWRWRVFAATPEADRSLKFLRAAYVWLLLSLAMLVLLPAYQFGLLPWLAPGAGAARLGFSHAFYGATRHAITVGFVSLMIVGVAAKVVPTLNGVDPRRLPSLWLPFLLINAGCTLRVVTQTLTDFTPAAFPVSGASGVLEVLGLAVWAAHLWPMLRGTPAGQPAGLPLPEHQPLTRDVPIGPEHLVGEVLDLYPELLGTFVAAGFHALNIPRLRNAVARRVTVARACRLVGVDRARLLADPNAERTRLAARRVPLPVVGGGLP